MGSKFSRLICGELVDVSGGSSNSSRCGCGDVGGVLKSSIGLSFGEDGGNADFSVCGGAGASGGVVATGVMVGGDVVVLNEFVVDEFEEECMLTMEVTIGVVVVFLDLTGEVTLRSGFAYQYGLTLILAVRLYGLDM